MNDASINTEKNVTTNLIGEDPQAPTKHNTENNLGSESQLSLNHFKKKRLQSYRFSQERMISLDSVC